METRQKQVPLELPGRVGTCGIVPICVDLNITSSLPAIPSPRMFEMGSRKGGAKTSALASVVLYQQRGGSGHT